VFSYWRRLRRRRQLETDLDDELRATLALLTAEKQRAGLAPDAAARAARLELGNLESLKEEVRDVVGVRLLHDFASDWRLAMRTLRRTPLVTSVAILSLALAVGANTAIFSIVNGLMLRTLPVRDPGGLVLLSDTRIAPRVRVWDYPFWQQIHQRPALFGGAAAWSFIRLDLASGGESQFVQGMWASGSLFDVLGVDAALGRAFGERDDQRGGGSDGPVAVISHAFWQRRFGGAPDVIGRVVRLNSVPFTIIGVTPRRFFGTEVGRAFDVILPLHTEPLVRGGDAAIDSPTNFLTVIARLRSDQSADGATAALRAAQPEVRAGAIPLQGDVESRFLERYLRDPFLAMPAETGFSNLRLQYERPMLVISAVVALVLLIACVNIANLLLARGLARRSEMQVRLAIGASRWRVARQLLTESLALAAAGAALGVALAPAVSRFLVGQLTTPTDPVFLDTALDLRVLAFTAAVTVMTALLFGTAPAFSAARVSLMHTLRDRHHAAGRQLRGGPAGWLVVVQVALTVVLVVSGGLFVRSFTSLMTRDLGFDADRVLVVTIDPERAGIAPPQRPELYDHVRRAVQALPAVADAAVSFLTPIATGGLTPPVAIDAAAAVVIREEVFGNLLSPGWFRTYGIRLVAGRDISDSDRAGAPRVAVVNETFARRYLGDGSPLGRTVVIWPQTPRSVTLTVVGVAADAAYFSARYPIPPSWYMPIAQFDAPGFPFSPIRLSVRPKSESPGLMRREVEAAVATIDPRLALTFRPLTEQVHASLTRERMMAQLAGFFGALALLLAGIGLYGLTAYGISRRRSEIGIRLALGAVPAAIVAALLGRVFRLVAAGLVAGIAASVWAAPVIGELIYGLQPRDIVTLLSAAVLLCVTAAVAGWLPARRAVRLDPAAALRED
jgi:predicted permease